jgi:hypothetical protein
MTEQAAKETFERSLFQKVRMYESKKESLAIRLTPSRKLLKFQNAKDCQEIKPLLNALSNKRRKLNSIIKSLRFGIGICQYVLSHHFAFEHREVSGAVLSAIEVQGRGSSLLQDIFISMVEVTMV